jgi:hypothetical protein
MSKRTVVLAADGHAAAGPVVGETNPSGLVVHGDRPAVSVIGLAAGELLHAGRGTEVVGVRDVNARGVDCDYGLRPAVGAEMLSGARPIRFVPQESCKASAANCT